MVDQYRYAVQARSIEFPQGFIDEGETPLQEAERELREEVGVEAKNLRWLNTLWVTSGYSTQHTHIFLAEDFYKSKQKLDDTEGDLTIKTFTLEEITELIKTGRIKNSPTLAALSIYLLYAKR